MFKTMTIAAGVLALSGAVALAQGNYLPPGPNAAPGGAGGSAPTSTIGPPSGDAQDTVGGGTRSTTILSPSLTSMATNTTAEATGSAAAAQHGCADKLSLNDPSPLGANAEYCYAPPNQAGGA